MSEPQAVFGIDLGTTNSCIGQFVDGKAQIIPIDGQNTIPSVVAFDGTQWLVGKRALNYQQLHPKSAASSIKRHMGETDYRCQIADSFYSPIEISSKILAYLKEQAEKSISKAVSDVVVTVPAWFSDEQRQATLSAARLAKLNILRIINEPTAAALAYSHTQLKPLGTEHWLVYDLGGGTFDVSLLAVSEGLKEVLATSGNCFLGGDDFDHLIVRHFITHLKDKYNTDPSHNPLVLCRLKLIAEQSKIALSTEPIVQIIESLPFDGRQLELDLELTRQRFEEMIADHVCSTVQKTRETLEAVHLPLEKVDRLLLVGGSTRIPMVSDVMEREFNLAADLYIDPDLSVALGATVQAAAIAGLYFKDTIIDVAPHSLGIAVVGDEDEKHFQQLLFNDWGDPESEDPRTRHPLTYVPLIKRHTKLPAKFTKEFYKFSEEQSMIEVAVYQGESKLTRENDFIGSFLTDVSQSTGLSVFISFEYDLNGIINIVVKHPKSPELTKRFSMDLSKIEPRLEQEKVFSEVDHELEVANNMLAPSEGTNYLIKQVDEALQHQSDEDEKERISKLCARYKALLSQGDDEAIDTVEEELYLWIEAKDMDSFEERRHE